jgi:pyruvate dehydrogenase E1 component beta subunit
LFEHIGLYNVEGEIDADAGAVDLEHARLAREGTDVVVVTWGGALSVCEQAARELESEHVSVAVLDLRVLRPLDDDAIVDAVARCHRVVVVDEGWRSGGLSAEVIARINERCFFDLDAPPMRVCAAEVPIPYPKHLEAAALPSVARVKDAVHAVLAGHAHG